jgi:anti-sigma regulatory factor (Ser/Thr protein kinase)
VPPGARDRLFLELPSDHGAASVARRGVSAVLDVASLPGELAYDILLVTSELVTNAIEHGGTPVHLELRVSRDRVVLRVHDRGEGLPCLRKSDPSTERSRGLRLVEALAEKWGYEEQDRGKHVWAEFTR